MTRYSKSSFISRVNSPFAVFLCPFSLVTELLEFDLVVAVLSSSRLISFIPLSSSSYYSLVPMGGALLPKNIENGSDRDDCFYKFFCSISSYCLIFCFLSVLVVVGGFCLGSGELSIFCRYYFLDLVSELSYLVTFNGDYDSALF